MSGRPSTSTPDRYLKPHISRLWWLERASYFTFMLRELSCIFVGWFAVYLLMLISAVNGGDARYQEFLAWSAGPGILLLNIVSMGFVVFHAVTFFAATPQALVVDVGGNRVPGSLIAASHYVAWVAVSVVICWILVGM
jgi:fumarate reductase subunit C